MIHTFIHLRQVIKLEVVNKSEPETVDEQDLERLVLVEPDIVDESDSEVVDDAELEPEVKEPLIETLVAF